MRGGERGVRMGVKKGSGGGWICFLAVRGDGFERNEGGEGKWMRVKGGGEEEKRRR